jgi:hypothetical protein
MDGVRRARLPIALLSAALLAAAPAGAHLRPHVSLARSEPPMIRGGGFHQRERVKVVVVQNWGAKLVKRTTANRAGRFKVAFPNATPPCGHYRVTATGSFGSRAVLAGMKLPDCVIR